MTEYTEIPIGDLFVPISGSPKFIRRYIEAHPGEHPVFSASLLRPFGYIDEFQFEGTYLSWTMNGYAGHVSEIGGRFSLTRDRGVFIPRPDVKIPDLTYLRLAMEPALTAAAVGRRIDGKKNTYTKIYPESAAKVLIRLPIDRDGRFDYKRMSELAAQYRRIESAKAEVQAILEAMRRSIVSLETPREPVRTLTLGGEWMEFIQTKTGWTKTTYSKRDTGNLEDVPVYSAAKRPVAFVKHKYPGMITASPENPIISFGANGDGSAGTNFVFHERSFYVSNDRTCLRVLSPDIDPRYVYLALHGMKERYGFDHAFKATTRNLTLVTFDIPATRTGFDYRRQQEAIVEFRSADEAKRVVQDELARLSEVRVSLID